MSFRVLAGLVLGLALVPVAQVSAGGLPEVRIGKANSVPACATPGRLTAYLQSRNKSLDPRFLELAAAYQKHGSALAMRWDYAYFQMLLETNFLSFRRGGGARSGMTAAQNNFAGLGAVGDNNKGESFPDVSTGVLAHLQHLMLYAGEPISNPVAERTRKVQQWGVLVAWHKARRGPMTFAELAQHWAPTDAGYGSDLESIAAKFYGEFCNIPDAAAPVAQIESAAKPASPARAAAVQPDAASASERIDALKRTEPPAVKSGLGATSLLPRTPEPAASAYDDPPAATALPARTEPPNSATAAKPVAMKPDLPAKPQLPSAGAASLSGARCNVWTASYGGGKALIVKSETGESTNYTVLEVTTTNAAQELQSYIKLYAKGGAKIAEFPDQAKALDKAFELCPEG